MMDEKKLKKNVRALMDIFNQIKDNQLATSAIDQPKSSLKTWLRKSNYYLLPCTKLEHFGCRTFATLVQQTDEDFRFFKKSIKKFMRTNEEKFNAYIVKYTDFANSEDFVTCDNASFLKNAIELILLCQIHQQNLKVLYYEGAILKEMKLRYYSTKTIKESSSDEHNSKEHYDGLIIYLGQNSFIPILQTDPDSDETSSDSSIEIADLEISPPTTHNIFDSKYGRPNGVRIKEKYQYGSPCKTFSNFYPKFTNCIQHSSGMDDSFYNGQNFANNFSIDSEIFTHDSFVANIPKSHMDTNTTTIGDSSKPIAKKGPKYMRSLYLKKSAVRSEEQTFKPLNMTSQVIGESEHEESIEEESEPTKTVGLKASSKSFKPKGNKLSSSNKNMPSLTPLHNPQYPLGPCRNLNSPYTMTAYDMMQMQVTSMAEAKNKKEITTCISDSQSPIQNKSNFNLADKNSNMDAKTKIDPKNTTSLHTSEAPVPNSVKTIASDYQNKAMNGESKIGSTSTKCTSGSRSPPIDTSNLEHACGDLKFFNQQKEYGFIVTDDQRELFFHFDDVKHLLLSKEFLRFSTENFDIRFSFNILDYVGKRKSSKKAVNINLKSVTSKQISSN